jgi:hypothetical protein
MRAHTALITTSLLLTVLGGACFPISSSKAQSAAGSSTSSTDAIELERQKFAFQKSLEERKLELERKNGLVSGAAVFVPLALGLLTLIWQSWSSVNIKKREARDTFEIKAADIIFKDNSTRGAKNRARALGVLFPGRIPQNIADQFDPSQFGGRIRYNEKLEIFKAACSKVQRPEDVYRIWFELFPEDKWIEDLVGHPSATSAPEPSSTSKPAQEPEALG